MAKIDYEYEITEERVRAYLKVPEIDRLRWLEELCAFTSMARQAATTYAPGRSLPASEKSEPGPPQPRNGHGRDKSG